MEDSLAISWSFLVRKCVAKIHDLRLGFLLWRWSTHVWGSSALEVIRKYVAEIHGPRLGSLLWRWSTHGWGSLLWGDKIFGIQIFGFLVVFPLVYLFKYFGFPFTSNLFKVCIWWALFCRWSTHGWGSLLWRWFRFEVSKVLDFGGVPFSVFIQIFWVSFYL